MAVGGGFSTPKPGGAGRGRRLEQGWVRGAGCGARRVKGLYSCSAPLLSALLSTWCSCTNLGTNVGILIGCGYRSLEPGRARAYGASAVSNARAFTRLCVLEHIEGLGARSALGACVANAMRTHRQIPSRTGHFLTRILGTYQNFTTQWLWRYVC